MGEHLRKYHKIDGAHYVGPGERYWTLERCKNSALQHKNKWEWYKSDKKAYNAAAAIGWLSECTAHMKPLYKSWTLDDCKQIALRFKTSKDWKANEGPSYSAAVRNGWLSECTAHMKLIVHPKEYIYMWETDQRYRNLPVFKIGICSKGNFDKRISEVCLASGWTCNRKIFLIKIGPSARHVETKMLKIGRKYKPFKFDGYTEMRAIHKSELPRIFKLIPENAIGKEA